MLKNLIHKIGTVLMALALFWIFAGSLVEFHQRYVFHKLTDLWQAHVINTGKDLKRSQKYFEKSIGKIPGFDPGPGLMSHCDFLACHPWSEYFRHSVVSFGLPDTSDYRKLLLRGPPAV